jgi:hypothetical protein
VSNLINFDSIVQERFVETGTWRGESLKEASKHFRECLSIELNERLYAEALENFRGFPNVKLYKGHSPTVLREVLDHRIPTTFWLDAHYIGSDVFGEKYPPHLKECPLLEELFEITRLNWVKPPIILIDDASIFLEGPPDSRFNKDHWPKISEIDQALIGYTRSIREYALLYQK